MVYLTTKQETLNSKEFAKRLVSNSYHLRDGECLKARLMFSSEWGSPNLYRINNYHFRMLNLINQMHREMSKLGIGISASKIKEDTLKKEVVIYQKMLMDKTTGRLVDYYFILDSKQSKVLVFRRETDFSLEQNRLYRAVKYMNDELFMDYEQIYCVLRKNGFDTTPEMVSHIVSEME